MDLTALAQDGPGAKESDAGDDLSRDARRVGGCAKGFEPERRKKAGADSDEAEGLDPGGMAMELSLYTDEDREDRGDEKTEGEVGVAV